MRNYEEALNIVNENLERKKANMIAAIPAQKPGESKEDSYYRIEKEKIIIEKAIQNVINKWKENRKKREKIQMEIDELKFHKSTIYEYET